MKRYRLLYALYQLRQFRSLRNPKCAIEISTNIPSEYQVNTRIAQIPHNRHNNISVLERYTNASTSTHYANHSLQLQCSFYAIDMNAICLYICWRPDWIYSDCIMCTRWQQQQQHQHHHKASNNLNDSNHYPRTLTKLPIDIIYIFYTH